MEFEFENVGRVPGSNPRSVPVVRNHQKSRRSRFVSHQFRVTSIMFHVNFVKSGTLCGLIFDLTLIQSVPNRLASQGNQNIKKKKTISYQSFWSLYVTYTHTSTFIYIVKQYSTIFFLVVFLFVRSNLNNNKT